ALATGQPVVVSPKFWAEHMGLPYHQADIRAVERPGQPTGEHARLMALSIGARRFTRYGYADLLREDRRHAVLSRVWPGTQRLLRELGSAGEAAEAALASASRVLPLITSAHDPSAANNRYWPEIYANMPIVDGLPHHYTDTAEPRRFGNVSALDPEVFSTAEE